MPFRRRLNRDVARRIISFRARGIRRTRLRPHPRRLRFGPLPVNPYTGRHVVHTRYPMHMASQGARWCLVLSILVIVDRSLCKQYSITCLHLHKCTKIPCVF